MRQIKKKASTPAFSITSKTSDQRTFFEGYLKNRKKEYDISPIYSIVVSNCERLSSIAFPIISTLILPS